MRAGERRERIKAFTREPLIVFFSKADTEVPRYAPLFFTMARAGVRLGEGLAMGNKAAVDRLDDATPGANGSKVVANTTFGGTGASELPELAGAGGGS